MRALFVFALLSFAVSCSAPVRQCDPSCLGCCDGSGECQLGTATTACGQQGAACQPCGLGQQCLLGQCAASSSSGGGTGGGAGADAGVLPSSCAGTLSRCGATCVDLNADDSNCGRCGTACTSGTVCTRGSCALLPADCSAASCPAGYGCDPSTLKCLPGCRTAPDCPSGAMCMAGACVCGAGKHACGSVCVSDDAVGSCGASCESCPGSANADATCVNKACGLTCRPGSHACNGACLSDTSVDSCGTRCTACPTPAGVTATCSAGLCGVSCGAGLHSCNSACVMDTAVSSCGTSCTPCPVPASGSATCSAGQCGVACAAGFHACNGACVSNTAVASCGSSCTPCPVDANGGAVCNAGTCGLSCNANFHQCGSTCVSSTALATCGTSCTPCPAAPANATATCNAGTCDFTCATNYSRCGNACCYAFSKVQTNANLSCGLTTTGVLKCWGSGVSGVTASLTAHDVTGFTGLVDFALGSSHLCAVTSAGEVRCLGSNTYAQSGGSAATSSYSTAHTVVGVTGATKVSASDRETCALAAGRVYCWGSPWEPTALGGTAASSGAVVQVPGLTTAVEVSVGNGVNSHACARLGSGTVWCWGSNGYGQLGPAASSPPSPTPVQVPNVTTATSLMTGYDSTCVVAGGTLSCFGYTYDSSARSWQVNGTTGVQSVGHSSSQGACVVMVGGQVRCWGDNFNGQLGTGDTMGSLTLLPALAGIVSAAATSFSSSGSCAVTTGGVAYCWGNNSTGRVGDGSNMARLSPVEVLRP